MGELVAEMTACYLANELNVPQSDKVEAYARYIKCWLKEMESDPKWVFAAASQASRAADYLLGFVQAEEAEPVPAAEDASLTA
jgi:antirestriction protein ArdC